MVVILSLSRGVSLNSNKYFQCLCHTWWFLPPLIIESIDHTNETKKSEFKSPFLVQPMLLRSAFCILSFSSVSWSALHRQRRSRCCEDCDLSLMMGDDWSPTWVWHVLSLHSLLKYMNCFELIFNLKFGDKNAGIRQIVFCRSKL